MLCRKFEHWFTSTSTHVGILITEISFIYENYANEFVIMLNTHGHTKSSMLTGIVCALNGFTLFTANCAWPTSVHVSGTLKAGCLTMLWLEEVARALSTG
jgi:hypothetical protein